MTTTVQPDAPPTEEFPVAWTDPADAALAWTRDRLHNPGQISPLTFDVVARCFGTGASSAMRTFSVPLAGWESRRFNTYAYNTVIPLRGAPEDMAAAGAAAEETMKTAMGRLAVAWDHELLPEIRDHLAVWEGYDLAGASLDGLLRHLDDTVERFTRLCDVHMQAVIPAYIAMSELDECYRGLFPDLGAFDGYKLVQGHLNKTVEVGHELWCLSRMALASPEVVAAIGAAAPRRASADVLADLATTGAGQDFAARLGAYLEVYGHRGDLFFDLDRPGWVEDPTPVFDSMRTYMTQPDDADPARVVARLAAEREVAMADARARLAGYPGPVRAQFEFLLEAATAGVVISEDHGFWIDFRAAHQVRRVLVEFGHRLADAGEIAEPADVFMLTLDEVKESAAAAALAAPCRSASGSPPARARLVERRRAEMGRFASVRPPDHLGAPPQGPPPGENPFSRFMTKFMGAPPVPSADDGDGVVRGNPGGPGRVRGVARVIRSITEAGRLAPGEILVAETTTPPWTPLFAVAAGVVTDTGGVLSHCAVVAREYGLPAVVGTGRGTDRITDGMVITVDGDNGVVHLS